MRFTYAWADGHCSALFAHQSVALYDKGRVRACAPARGTFQIVDAITGERVSDWAYEGLAADTSGALMWSGLGSSLVTSSGPNSDGCELEGVECTRGGQGFRFGVVALRNDSLCRILRFDGERVPVMQPMQKASKRSDAGGCHG